MGGFPEDSVPSKDVLTDRVLECLKFAVDSTREAGGIKEMGIRANKFSEKYSIEKEVLIAKGYLSRQIIFDCGDNSEIVACSGVSANSGVYIAVTTQGLDFYKDISKGTYTQLKKVKELDNVGNK